MLNLLKLAHDVRQHVTWLLVDYFGEEVRHYAHVKILVVLNLTFETLYFLLDLVHGDFDFSGFLLVEFKAPILLLNGFRIHNVDSIFR